MGRVIRSRPQALLRAPAPAGTETVKHWMEAHGNLLGWTTGPRLVDCCFVPEEGKLVAVLDGPDESSFEPLVESTAAAIGVSADEVQLQHLVSGRGDWPF